MKRRELEMCCVCGKGVAHGNNIAFYRIKIEHMLLHAPNIQRRHGLEQFFGGGQAGAVLAEVMGDDGDIAVPVTSESGLICQVCAITGGCVAAVFEKMGECAEKLEAKQLTPSVEKVDVIDVVSTISPKE